MLLFLFSCFASKVVLKTSAKRVLVLTEALLLATDIYVLSQSPATIMYHRSFTEDDRPTRKNMYCDAGIAELRNHLISLIYTDANDRAAVEQ